MLELSFCTGVSSWSNKGSMTARSKDCLLQILVLQKGSPLLTPVWIHFAWKTELEIECFL
jgi:hypothetical protein